MIEFGIDRRRQAVKDGETHAPRPPLFRINSAAPPRSHDRNHISGTMVAPPVRAGTLGNAQSAEIPFGPTESKIEVWVMNLERPRLKDGSNFRFRTRQRALEKVNVPVGHQQRVNPV